MRYLKSFESVEFDPIRDIIQSWLDEMSFEMEEFPEYTSNVGLYYFMEMNKDMRTPKLSKYTHDSVDLFFMINEPRNDIHKYWNVIQELIRNMGKLTNHLKVAGYSVYMRNPPQLENSYRIWYTLVPN